MGGGSAFGLAGAGRWRGRQGSGFTGHWFRESTPWRDWTRLSEMKLLLERERREAEGSENARREILVALRERLARIAPGAVVWVYGSVTKAGGFDRYSDVDVAFESLPLGRSLYAMQSLLSEACGREVDVCFLHETRLEEKIRREGERWTE